MIHKSEKMHNLYSEELIVEDLGMFKEKNVCQYEL